MNKKNNYLEFGTEPEFHAIIKSGDGVNISPPLYSKKTVYDIISVLAEEKVITPAEFSEMKDQMLTNEKLPWSSREDNNRDGIAVEVIDFSNFGFGLGSILGSPFSSSFDRGFRAYLPDLFLDFLLSRMDDLDDFTKVTVEKPTFIPCPCGKKHGKIYTKTHMTGDFSSVKHGEVYLKTMLHEEIITEQEKAEVLEQIKKFFTPEDKK